MWFVLATQYSLVGKMRGELKSLEVDEEEEEEEEEEETKSAASQDKKPARSVCYWCGLVPQFDTIKQWWI